MSLKLDTILGALLVGTWANSVLYTVEVIQAAHYYRHFKHDSWMLKLLVSSSIAIDSVSMIANYASVYLKHTRTHVIEQPVPLYIFTTGVVAALAQSFLAARYWRLIWLIAEAVTDISIALALLLELRKVKSSFKETRSLLNRLVAQTIQTGAAGATIALAILITNVPTGIAYCLGRVYCLTMLVTLNVRKTGTTGSSKGTSSGANLGTRGERGKQARSEGGDDYGGIRGFLVHIDTPQEFSTSSFKTKPDQGLPDDSPAVEIEMTVNDSASYSSKKRTFGFGRMSPM
ncbi:hypothetical protein B0H13DRAFT_1986007 [Mycena leptocephala]|nr:hypothetical protein B0H13DRAFT_1986007 [Mycena leptocephala]